ncbi:MAG: transcription termination/antitermination protein NusA, partial [Acidobacteria bacterium]
INHVSIVDAEQKQLEVIVDDAQLSLAIGKKGQNVRLAAKLLGWHIDIKSEEEKRQEIESQMAAMARRGAPITELQGLGEKTLDKLRNHGVETVEQLAQMTPDELTQIQGIGEKTVDKIRKVVTDYFEQGEAAPQAEAGAEPEATPEAAEADAAEEAPTGEAEAAPSEASVELPIEPEAQEPAQAEGAEEIDTTAADQDQGPEGEELQTAQQEEETAASEGSDVEAVEATTPNDGGKTRSSPGEIEDKQ